MEGENFIIEYDYFGISHSAEARERLWKDQVYYRCFLHNSGEQIDIAFVSEKQSCWIDLACSSQTALAQILGTAIENKLGRKEFRYLE